jgi:hypothetical protein
VTTERPCHWQMTIVTPEPMTCGDPAERRADGKWWCAFHWERRKDEPAAPTGMQAWALWYAKQRGMP